MSDTKTKKPSTFSYKRSNETLKAIISAIDRIRESTNTAERNRADIEATKQRFQASRMQRQHHEALAIYDNQSWHKWYNQATYCHIENGKIKVNHVDPIDDYSSLDSDQAFVAFMVGFPCGRIVFIPMKEEIRKKHLANGLLCPEYLKSVNHGKGMRLTVKNRQIMGMQIFKRSK